MALSALWFSVMSVLVKLAGQRLPYQQVVFARGFVTLVLSLYGVWRMHARDGSPIFGNRRGMLAFRGLLGFLGLNFYYYSLTALSLADATVIMQSSPIMTAVIAGWWLGEKSKARQWVVAFVAFIGVVMVAQPPCLFSGAQFQLIPASVAFAGAIVSAFAYVAVRVLSQTERNEVILFYFPLIASVLTLPLLPGHWLDPTPLEWLILLGVGTSTQLAQVAMTKGLALEPAGKAMTMAYLQVALALVWGVLAFHEVPNSATIAGALCIVVALLGLR